MSYTTDPYQVKAMTGTLITCDSAAKTILMHLDSQREGQAKFVLKDIDDHHVLVKTAHVEEIRDALASELEKNTYVPDPDMR